MDFYNNILKLMERKGVKSVYQMCKESGIPMSAMSELKNGKIKSFSQKNLKKLSDFFNVSIEELTEGIKKESASADPRIDEIVKSLNTLSDAQLDKLLDYLRFLTFEKNQ